jgi:hypothetical protein
MSLFGKIIDCSGEQATGLCPADRRLLQSQLVARVVMGPSRKRFAHIDLSESLHRNAFLTTTTVEAGMLRSRISHETLLGLR